MTAPIRALYRQHVVAVTTKAFPCDGPSGRVMTKLERRGNVGLLITEALKCSNHVGAWTTRLSTDDETVRRNGQRDGPAGTSEVGE